MNSTESMNDPAARGRIRSIDALRGVVILLMLVDHARERFFLHEQVADPMDAGTTDPALFLTRLSSHLCAPVFVFLTGLSAYLYANPAGRPTRDVHGFLFKRGLVLILFEVTLVNFAWFAAYNTLYLQVIWAIGLSMICLSAAAYLPRPWVGALGLLIVFGHNSLTPIQFAPGEPGYALWTVLHDRGYLISEGPLPVRVSYPVLAWVGVIMLGYACGPLFNADVHSARRRAVLTAAGLGALTLLFILRGFNIYGETLPWAVHESPLRTVMDFFNYTKYPPSLMFLLFTLGIGALLLAWMEPPRHERHDRTFDWMYGRMRKWAYEKPLGWLETFGSAPMFFYIVHLYALLICSAAAVRIFGPNMSYGEGQPDYFGFTAVGQVWLLSAALSIALYFPCRAFARFKRRSDWNWVKYF